MSTQDFDKIAARLAIAPGSTAKEIDVSPTEMIRLEEMGRVIRVGERHTGKRGRRPVEWALPGAEVTIASHITDAQLDAKDVVNAYSAYWASSNKLWRTREAYGAKSEQAMEMEAAHYAKYPLGEIPPTPTKGQRTMAGMRGEDKIEMTEGGE